MGYIVRPKDLLDRIPRIPTLISLDLEYSERNKIDFEKYMNEYLAIGDNINASICEGIIERAKTTLNFYEKMGIHT